MFLLQVKTHTTAATVGRTNKRLIEKKKKTGKEKGIDYRDQLQKALNHINENFQDIICKNELFQVMKGII